jgi:hypothetical protein
MAVVTTLVFRPRAHGQLVADDMVSDVPGNDAARCSANPSVNKPYLMLLIPATLRAHYHYHYHTLHPHSAFLCLAVFISASKQLLSNQYFRASITTLYNTNPYQQAAYPKNILYDYHSSASIPYPANTVLVES